MLLLRCGRFSGVPQLPAVVFLWAELCRGFPARVPRTEAFLGFSLWERPTTITTRWEFQQPNLIYKWSCLDFHINCGVQRQLLLLKVFGKLSFVVVFRWEFHRRELLSTNLFPDFLRFFPKKNRKSGNISKVGKFNRGQNVWNASHSNIWKKKMENMEIPKVARKKKWKFRQKFLR